MASKKNVIVVSARRSGTHLLTDLVVNNLKDFNSYNSGIVYLTDGMFIRNNDRNVCKIGISWKYNDFSNMLYNSKI